jgi:hypothetical protein
MGSLVRAHPILAGAGIGLAWGVAMRLWMRYISTNPEFSWSGTLFILGAATIAGAVLGLARLRRRQGGMGWWRFSFLALLLLGAGGAVMWPSVTLGAIALGRKRPAGLMSILLLGAVAAQVPVVQDAVLDNWRFGLTDQILATVWYVPMISVEAWGFSVAFAPRLDTAPVPTRLKAAMAGFALMAIVLVATFAIGMQG